MANARILAPWVGEENRSANYHLVSRVVEKRFHLQKEEKEQFVKLMRLYEDFCGVNVLSYCVMSNHFHILLEVPSRPVEGLSDEELLRRVALVQSGESVEILRQRLEDLNGDDVTEKGRVAYEELREQHLSRMWDLGKFMKALKQRFTRWFNIKHKRRGTLWESRYKSVLVEDGYASMVTAAYIDLNPVRAGMVKDPKDYRWSNYAAAVAGVQEARRGISRVLERKDSDGIEAGETMAEAEKLEHYVWRNIAGRYRVFLYEEGAEPGLSQLSVEVQGEKRNRRKGFTEKEIEKEKERAGELNMGEKLRSRSRYWVNGAVIGSRGFVDGVIRQLNEEGFWRNPRKGGASQMMKMPRRNSEGKERKLWSLRRLKNE